MHKRFAILVTLVAFLAVPALASADWLFTGFIGPVTNAKFDGGDVGGSTGFGVNLAKVFPTRGGAGFEFDFGIYPKFWEDACVVNGVNQCENTRLMSVSPNFFINPALPRVRPYAVVGPTISLDTEGGGTTTIYGFNAGGGAILFAGERGGVRVDLRYFRHFAGSFISTSGVSTERTDLSFFRIFFGGTLVLGS